MDDEIPSYCSFTGFVDYKFCFPKVESFWAVVGMVFFFVNFVSYFPQNAELITARSSYGLDPLSVFFQSLTHFFLVLNIICLKSTDFIGINQYNLFSVFPRFITFFNLMSQWILFLPVVYLTLSYHDREIRTNRKQDSIEKEWKMTKILTILLTVIDLFFLILWLILGMTSGFTSNGINIIGRISGVAATIIDVAFFIPQMITTCKLKSEGSLSLLMLEIQAPSDLLNALFMWLGNGDDWTTWICGLVDSTEEFCLLATCLVFKCIRARRAKEAEEANQYRRVLNASLETPSLSQLENSVLSIDKI